MPKTDPSEILRLVALALGHPKTEVLTQATVESLVDEWVRAMALIARSAGAPNPRNPMQVATAVLARMDAISDSLGGGKQLAPVALAPAAEPAPTSGLRAYEKDGAIIVVLTGFHLRVDMAHLIVPDKP
jgi:hypothetical protein